MPDILLRNADSVYERSITRFSDVVCQFTVANGNEISYEVLEVSPDPDPTERVERSIIRFKEVVCEFIVIDGTDVHAFELEPEFVDLTGGPVPAEVITIETAANKANGVAAYFQSLLEATDTKGFFWIRGDAESIPNNQCIYYIGHGGGVNVEGARFRSGHISKLTSFSGTYDCIINEGDQFVVVDFNNEEGDVVIPNNAGINVSNITASATCATAADVNSMLDTSVDTVVLAKTVPSAVNCFCMAVKSSSVIRKTSGSVGGVSIDAANAVDLAADTPLIAIQYNQWGDNMPLEQFPYTNFHELNLDWIIDEIKKARATQKDIEARLPEITEDILLQLIADGVIGFTLGTSYDALTEELTLSVTAI